MASFSNKTYWGMLSFDEDFQVDKLMADVRSKLYKQPLHKVMAYLRNSITNRNDNCDEANRIESSTIELMGERLKEITNEVIDSMLYQAKNDNDFYFYESFHYSGDEEESSKNLQQRHSGEYELN